MGLVTCCTLVTPFTSQLFLKHNNLHKNKLLSILSKKHVSAGFLPITYYELFLFPQNCYADTPHPSLCDRVLEGRTSEEVIRVEPLKMRSVPLKESGQLASMACFPLPPCEATQEASIYNQERGLTVLAPWLWISTL